MKEKNNKVKIGARINYRLYFMFKYICMAQGVTMESKIEEMLVKDVKSVMKKTWFQDHMTSLEKRDPTVFNMISAIFTGEKSVDGEEDEQANK
ncbi:hypothetical protein [Chromobacterium violaceum]|uniref:hypothetical protein n=1 Tax=Chromobacterium violaceum TaxID=536 RepID=UPI00111C37DA|nr:hypothetical protein [Chromobacterium violaceum]